MRRHLLVSSIRSALEHRVVELGARLQLELEAQIRRGVEPRRLEAALLADAEPVDAPELSGVSLEGRELDLVARALARLGAGTYGRCAVCGSSIPDEALIASPLEVRCPSCARSAVDAPRTQRIPV